MLVIVLVIETFLYTNTPETPGCAARNDKVKIFLYLNFLMCYRMRFLGAQRSELSVLFACRKGDCLTSFAPKAIHALHAGPETSAFPGRRVRPGVPMSPVNAAVARLRTTAPRHLREAERKGLFFGYPYDGNVGIVIASDESHQ